MTYRTPIFAEFRFRVFKGLSRRLRKGRPAVRRQSPHLPPLYSDNHSVFILWNKYCDELGNVMSKRHTILLDADIEQVLRKIQADMIRKTNRSVSFSSLINDTLRKSLL